MSKRITQSRHCARSVWGIYDAAVPPYVHAGATKIYIFSSDTLWGDVKAFGDKSVYRPVEELKALYERGITISVGEEKWHYRFLLAQLLGDNKGLNRILGYVEGFTANYCCRVCKMHREDCITATKDCADLYRTETGHALDLSRGAPAESGVKQKVVWEEVPQFRVTENVCLDLFHDFLEGVCIYDLQNIFVHSSAHVPLDVMNNLVQGFDYGKRDSPSKPPVFRDLRNLKMTGGEAMVLLKHFTVIFGDIFPRNSVWDFIPLLRRMADILFTFDLRKSDCDILQSLTSEHHKLYQERFNDRLRPKFHFLTHYATVCFLTHYATMLLNEAVSHGPDERGKFEVLKSFPTRLFRKRLSAEG